MRAKPEPAQADPAGVAARRARARRTAMVLVALAVVVYGGFILAGVAFR